MEPTHQLTLVADERRYDLVVPVGTRVTEVLAVLGISSSAAPSSVATAAGHVYGPQDRIGEELPTGAVLTVVRTTTHRLHREVVSLGRSSAAPGARAAGPSWAGGSRSVAAPERPAVSLVDDSTRRRDEVDDGEATVSRAALHAERRRRGRGRRPRRRGRGLDAGPALVVGTALVSLVAGVLALAVPAGESTGLLGSTTARWVASGLLLAAAAAATLLTPRHREGAGLVRLAGAPALAAAAGLVAPLADSPSRVAVSLTVAAALGAVVTALASSDGSPADRAERTATACLGGVAVVLALTVLTGLPLAAAAAVLVGLAPVVVRALPSASLDVDPTQLLDTDRLSTTVWSVRERHAARRRRVTAPDVLDRVAQARSVVSVGTAYLALLAAVGGWALALTPALSTIAPWARWAVLAGAAVALGYQSRHVRDRLARYAMLAAAASLTVAGSVALVDWDGDWRWPLVGVGVLLGVVGVVAAVAIAGGWASTRLSRLADRLESLAVVTALPLGVLAAGAVETLRRLTSG
ncbi:hypothetical protein [Phycicoccus sonneratiae]|uniref:EccD-like transmembrane domain-containing protein n=1 Tax=Phycicoccus sonneratiae TaxID=2807628 RepID=A0ABS2CGP6_9MICO|nr:hypothetical protein [Phycicoccus sonneraticus]MBM6399047.1 hypothetical protein [Phycicoccus sonneraticus]